MKSQNHHRIFAAIIISTSLVFREAEAVAPDELFATTSDQVVLVETADEWERDLSQGSGVVLGNSLCALVLDKDGTDILSNFHVIAFSHSIAVKTKGGKKKIAKIVWFDADKDLAILRTKDSLPLQPIKSISTFKVGQKVFALGAPKGLGWTFSDGIISGEREYQGHELIQTTAPISPGSSGGGLFNADGQLLGITMGVVQGQNLNFAIAITQKDISEFDALRKRPSVVGWSSSDAEWVVGVFKAAASPEDNWRQSKKNDGKSGNPSKPS